MSALLASGEGRYILPVQESGVEFDVDRLRWEHHQLKGELTVRARLAGVPAVLSSADFNLSSDRARTERARACKARAKTDDEVDWAGLVEWFCQEVLAAERRGQPAVLLRDLPRPTAADQLDIDGLTLLDRHPVILFGDGGSTKSYTGLYLAGRLEQRGLKVLYCDWEFSGEDHRDRLERLFGSDMPAIRYVRCERPLVHEVDRLRRIVRQDQIAFAVYDSIAFACDGPPEAAEHAGAYYRAVRSIGVGSLHIAHTTKGEHSDKKPFGSTFWHNGARATWYIKLASEAPDQHALTVGLFNRKSNIGSLRAPVGFEVTFDDERTTFRRINVADVADLSVQLPLWARIKHAVTEQPMTLVLLAEELGAKVDSVDKAVKRKPTVFTRIDGDDGVARIALLERRVS